MGACFPCLASRGGGRRCRTRETRPNGRISRVWLAGGVGERERTRRVACPFAFCSKMGEYTKTTPFGVILVPTTTRRDEHARKGVFFAVWSLSKDRGEGKRERTCHMACAFAFGYQVDCRGRGGEAQTRTNTRECAFGARSLVFVRHGMTEREAHERTRPMACSFVSVDRKGPDMTERAHLGRVLSCLAVME